VALTGLILQGKRGGVVVGEELGAIVALAAELADPLCCPGMAVGPLRTTDLAVRDLLRERVRERALDLAGHARPAPAPQKLLALERVQQLLALPARLVTERADGAQPGRAADHGGVLDEAPLRVTERVEARSDDRLDRVGQPLGLPDQPPAASHPGQGT